MKNYFKFVYMVKSVFFFFFPTVVGDICSEYQKQFCSSFEIERTEACCCKHQIFTTVAYKSRKNLILLIVISL